jgi:cytochrome c553
MERMRAILAGVTVAGIGAAGLVIWSGIVDVGARAPHGALTTALLHTTFERSVANHAKGLEVPDDLAAPGRVALGAQTYAAVCSNCHGSPGLGQSPIALSMRPSPQYLPAVVDQFSDAELAWIVDNGVRLSAMPAWPAEGRLDETWSMVAFLRRLPGMTAEDYAALTQPVVAEVPAMPFGAGVTPTETQMPRRSEPEAEYAWAVPAAGFGGTGQTPEPVARCASCHGLDGRGAVTGGEAPNLTIQSPDYLHAALKSYAEARRHSGFMQPQAAALSDAQMGELADYFTRVPRSAGGPVTRDPAVLERGREIAEKGIPELNVAACLDCHERGGDKPEQGLFIPSLYGQSGPFLRHQLDLFAKGNRGTTGIYNPMHAEAHGMTKADRDAVAAWLAAQPPVRVAGLLPQEAMPVAVPAQVEARCVTCHGADLAGDASGRVPNLTLQTAPYLNETLHALAHEERHGAQMTEMARSLSVEDIASIANYIGSLPPVAKPGQPDPAAVARGAALAANGDASRDLPACVTCHDEASVRNLPMFARLNGQSETYLKRRLTDLASPTPGVTPGFNPMSGIAGKLTEAERADLAAYFASLPPVPKP